MWGSRLLYFFLLGCLGLVGLAQAQDTTPADEGGGSVRALVIAYRLDSEPLQYRNAAGKPDGILIDIWRLWSRKSGIPVRFVGAYSRETQEMVRDGRADVMAGLFPNRRRAAFLDFSLPIHSSPYYLYYDPGAIAVTGLDKLAGVRIGVTRGSFHQDWLREHLPKARRVSFAGYDALFDAVVQGKVSVFVTQPLYLSRYLAKKGVTRHYRRLETPLYTRAYRAAVSKGRTDLLATIDRYMSQITARERQDITRAWLGSDMTGQQQSRLRLSQAERAWLAKHPVLRLGVDPDWPPFEFIDEAGRYRGIGADVMAIISESLGVTMKPLPGLTWQAVMEKARRGEVDVLPAVRMTQERLAFLRFTRPYFVYPYVIFVRRDSRFVTGLDDLAGRRVAVERAYATEDLLRRKHPEIVLHTYPNTTEALYALNRGEVDAYVGNLSATTWVLDKLGMTDIKIAAPTPYNFEQRIGVRKDWPELVAILDKAIAQITPAERQAIKNRWFAVRFEHVQAVDTRTLWQAVLVTVLVALPVLAVIMWWNRRLQREIRRRRESEAALRESEAQFKTIINSIPLSIVVASLDGEILMANPHAVREIESSADSLVGRSMLDFYQDPGEREALMQELAAQGQIRNRPAVFRTDRGRVLEGLISVIPITLGGRTVSLGILVNLTERMKMERELAAARDQAEQANRAKSVFLANMSHELRTPLNAIIGFTGILKDGMVGPVNEEQAKQLGMVYDSARHLLDLINDILDLSKVEAGRVELVVAPFDLDALLAECLALVRPLADAKQLDLRLEAQGCPRGLSSDRAKLRQVLVNLLGNAIKFTEQGSVTLTCRQENGDVIIEVTDTGIGIARQDWETVFNTFEQVETGSGREHEGTGLGLAICRRYVEMLGGEIRVARSAPGEGSTFRIRLPASLVRSDDADSTPAGVQSPAAS